MHCDPANDFVVLSSDYGSRTVVTEYRRGKLPSRWVMLKPGEKRQGELTACRIHRSVEAGAVT